MSKWGIVLIGVVASIIVIILGLLIYETNQDEGIKRYKYLDQARIGVKTEVYPVYIDIMFQREDVIEIEKAIDRWNKVFNGYRELEVVNKEYTLDIDIAQRGVEGKAYIILRIEPDSELLIKRDDSITLAFTNAIGGTIMYVVPVSIEKVKEDGVSVYGVMLHEMGHWFGARHIEEGLMQARYDTNDFVCIDEGTVRQAGAWFKYDWEKMNYCIKD